MTTVTIDLSSFLETLTDALKAGMRVKEQVCEDASPSANETKDLQPQSSAPLFSLNLVQEISPCPAPRIASAIVVGPRGSGKSSLIRSLIAKTNQQLRFERGHGYDFLACMSGADPAAMLPGFGKIVHYTWRGTLNRESGMIRRFELFCNAGLRGCMVLQNSGNEQLAIDAFLTAKSAGSVVLEADSLGRSWRPILPLVDAVFVSTKFDGKPNQDLFHCVDLFKLRHGVSQGSHSFHVFFPKTSERNVHRVSYDHPLELLKGDFNLPSMME